MEDAVNLPSRIVDISSPLYNETVMDHPFMRPKIEYRTNAQNAPMLLENFRKTCQAGRVGLSKL
jgi:hypothetical protein